MHGRRLLGGLSRRRAAPALLALLAVCTLTAWIPDQKPRPEEMPRPAFREVWAYLMRGEEKELTGTEPITDLCYFSVSMTREGRITEKVARPDVTMRGGARPAVHLVVAELANQALMHFALNPRYGVRPLLLEDIRRVSEGFDGVQIDFEMLHREDAELFFDFLAELRKVLPAGQELSIALPARTKLVAGPYDYTRIAPLVDRVIVMAYDEHWSTSAPGPVASLPWCAAVADYARSVIPAEKIVMGLPLYGRAWQDKRLARALRFSGVQGLAAEKQAPRNYAPEVGAWFEYPESVTVTVFYDDRHTLMEKLRLYEGKGVGAVSFWRIGQGPPGLWDGIDSTGPRVTGTGPAE